MWFNRDDEGYARLNVRMPQSTPAQRVVIEDNFWVHRGNVSDLISPPGGKSLAVSYANGDYLRIEFAEILDAAALAKRWPNASGRNLDLPLTTVEVVMKVPALGLSLHAGGTGDSQISGVIARCAVGLVVALGSWS